MGALSHAPELQSTMHLLVVRHAIAEERSPELDDESRELTKDGIRKLKAVVHALRDLDWKLDCVLTSPWTRALHTAQLLAPIASGKPITTSLLTGSPRAELLAQIAEQAVGTIAVVGHEPWLGELVAWLAFGEQKLGEQLELKKAGVVWLEGSAMPRGMKLRALMPPKLLGR
jgi:phosphohistidine phosphatase